MSINCSYHIFDLTQNAFLSLFYDFPLDQYYYWHFVKFEIDFFEQFQTVSFFIFAYFMKSQIVKSLGFYFFYFIVFNVRLIYFIKISFLSIFLLLFIVNYSIEFQIFILLGLPWLNFYQILPINQIMLILHLEFQKTVLMTLEFLSLSAYYETIVWKLQVV